VLNVVTNGPGESDAIGDELVENPKVRRISFTGSTETGRKIAERAGRYLKRVALELSGYNPLLVLRDADVEYAVSAASFGTFLHQGQICMSARNLIVERPVADTFVSKLVAKTRTLGVGDPRLPTTVIGPLINRQQLERVQASVDDAVQKGAKVLVGGKADGPCFQPTLLTGIRKDMRIDSEECFGPVAIVTVVDSPEEAVRVANDTRFGLSAGIITRNFDQALDIAERLETGMVHINDQPVHDEPQAPFGGVKDSGFGRMGGRAALEEFTELRWITVQREPRRFPF
jgi:aldehyde dehydrogenase (NAD+)